MIAYEMDAGDRRIGIAVTRAAGYRSVSLNQSGGWCYAGADRERR
jgi:VCBS repeat-containing protein